MQRKATLRNRVKQEGMWEAGFVLIGGWGATWFPWGLWLTGLNRILRRREGWGTSWVQVVQLKMDLAGWGAFAAEVKGMFDKK